MPPKRKKNIKTIKHKTKRAKKNANVKENYKIKEDNSVSSDNSQVCVDCNEIIDEDTIDEHTKVCSAKNDLNIEFTIEPKKPIFPCEKCPKKFKYKKKYNEHLLREHSELPNSVSCEHCTVKCPNEMILKDHIKMVHERVPYECPGCKKGFARYSHVLRHIAQRGCNGEEVTTYVCEICNVQFTRKDNLMVHLRMQHIYNKNVFACKYCIFNTKTFSKLVNHWHKTHSGTPNLYECDHCGKSTSSRGAMTKHLEIHGERKYACAVCGYNTFTVEVMRRHVLTHERNKPFKCHLCNCSYIQRLQLNRHLEKHKENVCLECKKTFPSKARLLIHQRVHMGLDNLYCPFETCPYSKKEFMSDSSLSAHMKTHLEPKPFSCEVCGKRFLVEMNMRRHLATHKLDRPRRCMYCVSARAYVRGEQLVRHVRRTHAHIFRGHLRHVRQVLGASPDVERVKKSELDSILNVLDAEAERIMQGYGESGVLYGGVQENENENENDDETIKEEIVRLMTEDELAENLNKLLSKLIDKETLECFGWPETSVDVVLEKVIEQCGSRPADREMWTRMQCLRENAKHLFLYVIEDKNISEMLATHTIDQIIKHILAQVDDEQVE